MQHQHGICPHPATPPHALTLTLVKTEPLDPESWSWTTHLAQQ